MHPTALRSEAAGLLCSPAALLMIAPRVIAGALDNFHASVTNSVTKEDILREIRRTAAENGGQPLGLRTFERSTGIRPSQWFGVHWRSWSDAVAEAGFEPNAPTKKIEDTELLRRYCLLARRLGRFPTKGDLRLEKRRDAAFPAERTLTLRFGQLPQVRARARAFALEQPDFADVAAILEEKQKPLKPARSFAASSTVVGFVYMVKHGSRSEYKIGKTFNPVRREGEVRLQLPERLEPIHYIATDDPGGIEAYWHNRFSAKRKEGEWFTLTPADVTAFKKWKRIS